MNKCYNRCTNDMNTQVHTFFGVGQEGVMLCGVKPEQMSLESFAEGGE